MPAAGLLRRGLLLQAMLLAACSPTPPAVEQIRERGVLHVATLNSPTTYYEGAHGPQGAEYRLAAAFAAELGVELHLYPVAGKAALREELRLGRADLVAAGITPSHDWNIVGQPSATYRWVPQVVVGRRDAPRARDLEALRDRLVVIRRDGPQLGMLDTLRARGANWLQWRSLEGSEANPVGLVARGEADYAVVDADEFSYAQHLHPGVAAAFRLPDARPAHWIVRRHAGDLTARVNAFFDTLRAGKRLERMLAASVPAPPDLGMREAAKRLERDIAEQLPALRPFFEEAQTETGVDWRLLAALGYVESKWQHVAVSPDGAQGIMMLTGDTAASLGVTDRTDPRESIRAGARYFVQVRDKVPGRITEPDRTWFTLAAYNVGYGHLEDARRLAQSRGGNPDRWADVREALPLLTQEKWYLQARHGYARGWEPVQMVDKVQTFLKLLEWRGESLDAAPGTDEARDGT